MALNECSNCSSPGRTIYHPGECPGVRASQLQRVISPFGRDPAREKDRQLYAKSNWYNAPGHKSPWGRDQNPGAYGQRAKPVRLRSKGRISVSVPK